MVTCFDWGTSTYFSFAKLLHELASFANGKRAQKIL
jgi:hypothetical protein